MKNRETLNFYRSFYEAGKQLQDEERLQFYDAILEKSFEKNVKRKKLNGIADILFTAILPTLTSQNRNYLNGLKGVKAKKTNPPNNSKTTTLDNSLTTYKEKDKEKEKEKEKDKDNKEKNIKKKYGEFQNVLLTIDEYDRLKTDWGDSERERMLKIFSEGLKMKSYSYKDHNLAIRKWKSNEKKNGKKETGFNESDYQEGW